MQTTKLKLTDEQNLAVQSDAQLTCILACAGSGKTTTLTRKIAKLINDNGVNPSNIVAITFTVLAGENLKYELSRILTEPSASAQMFVGTIHSFCFHLLISEGVLPSEAFEPITQSQQFILFSKNWTNWEISKVKQTGNKTQVIERLITTIDIVKMNDIVIEELRKSNADLVRVYELYNDYLNNNGFMDYSDMLIKLRDLLLNNDEVRSRCTNQYPFIFVDEYQDVDPVQAKIIDIFRQEVNLCVVGDDDQAIYQFRGADERNIQAFANLDNCQNFPLSENRRCPKNILSIGENNIKKVQRRLPKSMYATNNLGFISLNEFQSLDDELRFITETIKRLDVEGQISSFGQIGILLRSMASYGSLYVNALKCNSIPCVSRGARTLFSAHGIVQVTSIIEWFAKDEDRIEYLTELTCPQIVYHSSN